MTIIRQFFAKSTKSQRFLRYGKYLVVQGIMSHLYASELQEKRSEMVFSDSLLAVIPEYQSIF